MGFGEAQLYGTQAQKEETDPHAKDCYGREFSARIFLQKLGTEGLRQFFGEDVHLNAMVEEIRRRAAEMPERFKVPVFVCDDTRFRNEVAFVRALSRSTGDRRGVDGVGGIDGAGASPPAAISGTVIKIVCRDAPPSGNDNHPSEREVDEIDGGMVDALVISSRAEGVQHLIAQFEAALNLPQLRAVRLALESSARFRDSLRSWGV